MWFVIEPSDSCRAGDGRMWKVDGRAQVSVRRAGSGYPLLNGPC